MQQIQYENKLRAKGFQSIGKGMYANVFAIPNKPDKVIKIARLDAWPDYIRWATQNGFAGKFAPKVDSLKFFDDFYVAVMERLVDTIGNLPNTNSYHYDLYHRVISTRHNEEDEETDLADFMGQLRDEGMTGDLHPGNVMVRKDGQIVVTDPTSRHFSSDKFRIKSGQTTAP